jgi:hypothetical protein
MGRFFYLEQFRTLIFMMLMIFADKIMTYHHDYDNLRSNHLSIKQFNHLPLLFLMTARIIIL